MPVPDAAVLSATGTFRAYVQDSVQRPRKDSCACPLSPMSRRDSSSSTGRRECGLPDRGYETRSRATQQRRPWLQNERAAWQRKGRETIRPPADTRLALRACSEQGHTGQENVVQVLSSLLTVGPHRATPLDRHWRLVR